MQQLDQITILVDETITLKLWQKQYILHVLNKAGSVNRAAKVLDIDRRTLNRKMKEMGITRTTVWPISSHTRSSYA